ncbi:carbohydrate ABC transporter permease [Dactylosporangium sp. CA-233914]|uniref:carbohydrate ABC transporter permease n=1 Tax=Dactylosporangium sp. CA-233914 TaxID=3239934 RepID=UPI003D94023D
MQSKVERVVTSAALGLFAVVVLFPVAWFVLIALSPGTSGTISPRLHFSNFVHAWQVADFSHAMVASLVVVVVTVVAQVVLAVMTGYGLGVLNAAGHRVIFPVLLLGMMISTEATIVPLYYQFRDLGLTNSWLGLIIIHTGMGIPFGAFWMRATFRALPPTILEAARLDGAGSIRLLWSVLMPLARPAIYTLLLLSFMWTWNDYFIALVFMSDPVKQTAPVALGIFQGRFLVEVNYMAAASLIVAAPVLILYVFFQRQFIRGVLGGAIKE